MRITFLVGFTFCLFLFAPLQAQDISWKEKSKNLQTNNIASLAVDTWTGRNSWTIVGVGDVLLHQGLHMQALREPNGHISLWSDVLDIISSSDISYANLEGPAAYGVNSQGREVSDPGMVFDKYVYSSYPMFNYHNFLIDDLKSSGFDIVSTSNNHSLDRGSLGVDKTIEALNKSGLQFVGTRERDSRDWYTIVEKNGLISAFVACTYSTNGLSDKNRQIMHCDRDREEMFGIIESLSNRSDVDLVIATPHFGNEYELSPNAYQKSLASSLIDKGARIVFGAHPHVVQPWERYTSKDGRDGLIVYSLGNFVSGQFHRLHTRGSVAVSVIVSKDVYGQTKIKSASAIPLEMVKKDGLYQVVKTDENYGNQDIKNHILKSFSPISFD